MEGETTSRREVFAKGVVTTAVYHALFVAAFAILWLRLPTTPDPLCQEVGYAPNCASDRLVGGLFAIVFGVPLFIVSIAIAIAMVGGFAAARLRSGVLAGTIGTLVGVSAGAPITLILVLAMGPFVLS